MTIQQPQETFKRYTVPEICARPPKQWLINDILGIGDIGMLFGDSGSGKTFLTLDLAFALATGQQFFADRFAIAKPAKVIYCIGEGVGGFPARLSAVASKYNVSPANVPNLTIIERIPQLYAPAALEDDYRNFILSLTGEKIDLVIFDTYHSATVGSDENSARDVGVVLRAAKFIYSKLHCAILFLHHSNKANGDYRGSSALKGAMDSVLQTSLDGMGYGILNCYKLKDAANWGKLGFRLESDPWSNSAHVQFGTTIKFDNGEELREKLKDNILDLLALRTKQSQSEIVREFSNTASRVTILNALKELEDDGEIIATKGKKNTKQYELRVV